MKKKVKGSSWRYNAGIARPWLNEEEESPETSESNSENEGGEEVEYRAYAADTGEEHAHAIDQLSQRIHNLGEVSGHQAAEMPSGHAPEPVPYTGYMPSVPPAKTYLPATYASPVQFDIPRKTERPAEPQVELSAQQNFAPPPAPASEPLKAAHSTEFNPPPSDRPHIPAQTAFTPNIPPLPPAPTTQRIAERLAQQRMEGYWQVPPAAEQPSAYSVETHVSISEVATPVAAPVVEPAVEKIEPQAPPVRERPVFTAQSPFAARPFHGESYFAATENTVVEPVSPIIEPSIREAEMRVPMAEIAMPAIVESQTTVAQPSEVETPRPNKPETVATPRYGAPAAPVQESVFQPAQPQQSPVQPQRESSSTYDEQLLKRLAAQQAVQAAEAKAAQEIAQVAQKAEAHPQEAKEKPQETTVTNLPARLTNGERPSGFARTLSVIRSAIPIVQRLLPLLEGNVSKAVSNLLATQNNEPAAPPPPPVDLVPVQRGLAEIQKQHRELREQIATQNVSLQRVEDQLSHVATATDRNTREQQELVEEIQVMGKRYGRNTTIVVILLLISIAANVLLFLLVKRIIQ